MKLTGCPTDTGSRSDFQEFPGDILMKIQ